MKDQTNQTPSCSHSLHPSQSPFMVSQSPLVFTVRRCQPELVAPAKPTPHENKLLSDLDNQESLRFQIPFIYFYRYEPSMAGKDPVEIIRHALAETLVFYYPFAGRLREGPGRKLMVDCTGEGIMFIEADADVTLHQFGDSLQPPFPCFQELLYNVPGSEGVINGPLLLIRVTRLKCGGFIFAIRLNHTMSDPAGIVQFMNALAEITQGAAEPSILPVWHRELLNARDPPRITSTHREYEEVPDTTIPWKNIAHRSFFFGPVELAAIHRLVPHHLSQSTTFDVLTACLWQCRTKALQLDPSEEVRMMPIVNLRHGRGRFNPQIPTGYYGNAFVYPAAVTTVRKLCESPLGYALELVKKVKDEVREEYVRSVEDLMVIKGRPHFTRVRSYIVSDVTRAGFRDVNFGWGKAVYAGPANAGIEFFPGVSFYIAFTNTKGKEGIVVPIILPTESMEKFEKELDGILNNRINVPQTVNT